MSTFTGHIHGAAIIFDWADLFSPSSLPICLSACVLSLSLIVSLYRYFGLVPVWRRNWGNEVWFNRSLVVDTHILHHRAEERKEADNERNINKYGRYGGLFPFHLPFFICYIISCVGWMNYVPVFNSKDDDTAEGSLHEAPQNLENLFLSILGRL